MMVRHCAFEEDRYLVGIGRMAREGGGNDWEERMERGVRISDKVVDKIVELEKQLLA
jgi:hypothetical protein